MSSEQFSSPSKDDSPTSKCPIDHNSTSKSTWLDLGKKTSLGQDDTLNSAKKTSSKSCPIDHDSTNNIDQRNFMPKGKEFNLPSSDQKTLLNQERAISSIPKAEGQEESHWVYPSQQMFFNAMKRKNWNPSEEDMKVIVPIHNAVNERAWNLILKYEELYKNSCGNPRLVKFQGRPKDITPKARIKSWFGYALPFDRHDWIVDRCGTEVRYVIDFYSGKPSPFQPDLPSFYLDVRPALTPQGFIHRVGYFLSEMFS